MGKLREIDYDLTKNFRTRGAHGPQYTGAEALIGWWTFSIGTKIRRTGRRIIATVQDRSSYKNDALRRNGTSDQRPAFTGPQNTPSSVISKGSAFFDTSSSFFKVHTFGPELTSVYNDKISASLELTFATWIKLSSQSLSDVNIFTWTGNSASAITIERNQSSSAPSYTGFLRFKIAGSHYFVSMPDSYGSYGAGDDKWYHIVIRKKLDSSSTKPDFFVNGVQRTSVSKPVDSGTAYTPPTGNQICFGSSVNNSHMHGFMAEFCMWSKMLTDEDIQALYNSTNKNYYTSAIISNPPKVQMKDTEVDPKNRPLPASPLVKPEDSIDFAFIDSDKNKAFYNPYTSIYIPMKHRMWIDITGSFGKLKKRFCFTTNIRRHLSSEPDQPLVPGDPRIASVINDAFSNNIVPVFPTTRYARNIVGQAFDGNFFPQSIPLAERTKDSAIFQYIKTTAFANVINAFDIDNQGKYIVGTRDLLGAGISAPWQHTLQIVNSSLITIFKKNPFNIRAQVVSGPGDSGLTAPGLLLTYTTYLSGSDFVINTGGYNHPYTANVLPDFNDSISHEYSLPSVPDLNAEILRGRNNEIFYIDNSEIKYTKGNIRGEKKVRYPDLTTSDNRNRAAIASPNRAPNIFLKNRSELPGTTKFDLIPSSSKSITPFDDSPPFPLLPRDDPFVQTSTSQLIVPGFNSSLREKSHIQIDLSNSSDLSGPNQNLVYFSATGSEGTNIVHTARRPGSGMAYWNTSLRRWEMLDPGIRNYDLNKNWISPGGKNYEHASSLKYWWRFQNLSTNSSISHTGLSANYTGIVRNSLLNSAVSSALVASSSTIPGLGSAFTGAKHYSNHRGVGHPKSKLPFAADGYDQGADWPIQITDAPAEFADDKLFLADPTTLDLVDDFSLNKDGVTISFWMRLSHFPGFTTYFNRATYKNYIFSRTNSAGTRLAYGLYLKAGFLHLRFEDTDGHYHDVKFGQYGGSSSSVNKPFISDFGDDNVSNRRMSRDRRWFHIAIVIRPTVANINDAFAAKNGSVGYDDARFLFMVDGKVTPHLYDTDAASNNFDAYIARAASSNFFIGGLPPEAIGNIADNKVGVSERDNSFRGYLAEFCYWDKTLSRGSIKALYDQQFGAIEPYAFAEKDRKLACLGFNPIAPGDSIHSSSVSMTSAGQPTSTFGFPNARQYHATSSNLINMSDYIRKPFVVEKIILEVSGVFGLPEMRELARPVAEKALSLGSAGGDNGRADNDRVQINYPAAAGGTGTNILLKLVANLGSPAGANEIHVIRQTANNDTALLVRAAINGNVDSSFDASKISYGSGTGSPETGLTGLVAKLDGSATLITLTGQKNSFAGNGTRITNVAGAGFTNNAIFRGGRQDNQSEESPIQKQFFILRESFNDYSGSFEAPHLVNDRAPIYASSRPDLPGITTPVQRLHNSTDPFLVQKTVFEQKGVKELVAFSKIAFVNDFSLFHHTGSHGFRTNHMFDKILRVKPAFVNSKHGVSASFKVRMRPQVVTPREIDSFILLKDNSGSIGYKRQLALGNVGGPGMQGLPSARSLAGSSLLEPRASTVVEKLSNFKKHRKYHEIPRKHSPYILLPEDKLVFGWQNHPFSLTTSSSIESGRIGNGGAFGGGITMHYTSGSYGPNAKKRLGVESYYRMETFSAGQVKDHPKLADAGTGGTNHLTISPVGAEITLSPSGPSRVYPDRRPQSLHFKRSDNAGLTALQCANGAAHSFIDGGGSILNKAISVWFKSTAPLSGDGAEGCVFAKAADRVGNGEYALFASRHGLTWYMWDSNNQKGKGYIYGNILAGDVNLFNRWTHVVVMVNSFGYHDLFVNGVQLDTPTPFLIGGAGFSQMRLTTNKFSVGNLSTPSDEYAFTGEIANVAVIPNNGVIINNNAIKALYNFDPSNPNFATKRPSANALSDVVIDRLGDIKVHLYGSFIANNEEHLPNAEFGDRSNDVISTPIGEHEGPPLDQYGYDSRKILSSSYSDRIIFDAGSFNLFPPQRYTGFFAAKLAQNRQTGTGIRDHVFTRGSIGSNIAGDGGVSSSLNPFTMAYDFDSAYTDSIVPNYGLILGTKYFSGTTDDEETGHTSEKWPFKVVYNPGIKLESGGGIQPAGGFRSLIFSNNPNSGSYKWYRSFSEHTNLNDIFELNLLANNSQIQRENEDVFTNIPAVKRRKKATDDSFVGIFRLPGLHAGVRYDSPASWVDGRVIETELPPRATVPQRSAAILVDVSNIAATSSYRKFVGRDYHVQGVRGLTQFKTPTHNAASRTNTSRSRTGVGIPFQTSFGNEQVEIQNLIFGASAGLDAVKGPAPIKTYDNIRVALQVRAFRYGIMNATPIHPGAAFRRDHFGFLCDLIYSSPEGTLQRTAIADAEGRGLPYLFSSEQQYNLGRRYTDPPVTVRFKVLGENVNTFNPETTNSQNLSSYATSSMPYIDEHMVDRLQPLPEEADVVIIEDQDGEIQNDE